MIVPTRSRATPKSDPQLRPVSSPLRGSLTISQRTFRKYQAWLEQAVGIRLADTKRPLLVGRLSSRLKALGVDSFEEYFSRIQSSSSLKPVRGEQQVAIDLLTTNETYFFREPFHFDFIRSHCLPKYTGDNIRCLSAASSTGEEAYSLAFLLARHHQGGWRVEGCDVSDRVIKTATTAIYPIERASQIRRPYLVDYCQKGTGAQNGRFKISDTIRQKVTFYKANLLTDRFSHDLFDLVLLRNVLIYFDAPTKQKVVNNVLNSVKPGGYLIIGHSDSLMDIETDLKFVAPSIFIKAS